MLFHFINSSNSSKISSWKQREDLNSNEVHDIDVKACIAESSKMVSTSYGQFKNKAKEQASGASLSLHFWASYHVCFAKVFVLVF